MRSNNVSPHNKHNDNQDIEKNEMDRADIGSLIKKLPKTV